MRAALARALYAGALWLATPLYFARLWWRGRQEPLYRRFWPERLGYAAGDAAVGSPVDAPVDVKTGCVWLHAVSLGETLAARPLIDALRAQRPGLRLLLTHGTATGREAGQALLQPGDAQAWLPYDTPGAVRRFLRRQRPAVGVLMETEVWPGLLQAARAAGVPMVLANARLSERSLRKAQRLATLMRPAVASFRCVLAQTETDARRLRAAGAPAHAVQVQGNLKFDLSPDPELLARGQSWRALVHAASDPPGRRVLLLASSREGEEAELLAAWADLPRPRPLLLLVPRHPQRFDDVAALVAAAGLSLLRRSQWTDTPPAAALDVDVWLGDSLGEMPLYYGLADVGLLGGSFAPLGGHNLIEAAACGCPLVLGPHTFNFAQAAELSLAAGAALRQGRLALAVPQAVQLAAAPERHDMASRALRFAAQHRGAAARMAAEVLRLL
jgi:3-deoxy-D-manno-octulosonic-acid transferase